MSSATLFIIIISFISFKFECKVPRMRVPSIHSVYISSCRRCDACTPEKYGVYLLCIRKKSTVARCLYTWIQCYKRAFIFNKLRQWAMHVIKMLLHAWLRWSRREVPIHLKTMLFVHIVDSIVTPYYSLIVTVTWLLRDHMVQRCDVLLILFLIHTAAVEVPVGWYFAYFHDQPRCISVVSHTSSLQPHLYYNPSEYATYLHSLNIHTYIYISIKAMICTSYVVLLFFAAVSVTLVWTYAVVV